MKKAINRFIDWFEDRFNIIIDILALIGGAFCIFLAIFLFVVMLFSEELIPETISIIFVPGAIGFFGIIILFALRVTRNITKK